MTPEQLVALLTLLADLEARAIRAEAAAVAWKQKAEGVKGDELNS